MLAIFLGVKVLGHRVFEFSALVAISKHFSNNDTNFYSHQQFIEHSNSYSCQKIILSDYQPFYFDAGLSVSPIITFGFT